MAKNGKYPRIRASKLPEQRKLWALKIEPTLHAKLERVAWSQKISMSELVRRQIAALPDPSDKQGA